LSTPATFFFLFFFWRGMRKTADYFELAAPCSLNFDDLVYIVAGPVVVTLFFHLITPDSERYLIPSTVAEVLFFMVPSWVLVGNLPYSFHMDATDSDSQGFSGLVCQRISSLHDP
jgi:hypothetical protein